MKDRSRIKTAVVGCGEIARWHHIPSLLKLKDSNLTAICDIDEISLKKTAQKFRISNYYTNFSEMITKENLDMVDICTPPRTHCELALQAADAGLHILMEKPFVLNLTEFDNVVTAAKKSGVKLCPVHSKLFEPVLIDTIARINKGYIGTVTGIDIQVLHSLERTNRLFKNRNHWYQNLPGGIFCETMPHPLYIAIAFLGHIELLGKYFEKSSSYEWVIADQAMLIIRGSNGLGTINFISNSPKSKNIIDIHGTRKHLRVDLFNSLIIEYGIGTGSLKSRAMENMQQGFSTFWNTASTAMKVASGNFHSGHYNLIKRFLSSIREDTEPPVDLTSARNVVEITQKIVPQ